MFYQITDKVVSIIIWLVIGLLGLTKKYNKTIFLITTN